MAEPNPMSPAEFQDLIDRLGVDPACWPEAERVQAQALLEGSTEARAMLAEGQRLKEALRGKPVKAPPGLASRIVAEALGEADRSAGTGTHRRRGP